MTECAHVQPHRGLRSPLVGGKVPSVGLGDLTVVPSHASSAQCAPLHKCNTSHGTSSGLKATRPPCLKGIGGLARAGPLMTPRGERGGETPRQSMHIVASGGMTCHAQPPRAMCAFLR